MTQKSRKRIRQIQRMFTGDYRIPRKIKEAIRNGEDVVVEKETDDPKDHRVIYVIY